MRYVYILMALRAWAASDDPWFNSSMVLISSLQRLLNPVDESQLSA